MKVDNGEKELLGMIEQLRLLLEWQKKQCLPDLSD